MGKVVCQQLEKQLGPLRPMYRRLFMRTRLQTKLSKCRQIHMCPVKHGKGGLLVAPLRPMYRRLFMRTKLLQSHAVYHTNYHRFFFSRYQKKSCRLTNPDFKATKCAKALYLMQINSITQFQRHFFHCIAKKNKPQRN